jgi:hypothetical protein
MLLQSLPDYCTPLVFFDPQHRDKQRPSADVRLICGAADRPHAARLCSADLTPFNTDMSRLLGGVM